MYNLPEDITPDDAGRWLRGTWVYHKGQPVKVCGINTADGLIEGYCADGERISMCYDAVRVSWPLCGSINLVRTRCAIQAKRTTFRQWRRGVALESITLLVPGSLAVQRVLGKPPRCNEGELACSLMMPQYPASVPAALSELARGRKASIALSPTTIVVCDGSIYYRGQLVAKLYGSGKDKWQSNTVVPLTDKRLAMKAAAVLGMPLNMGEGI